MTSGKEISKNVQSVIDSINALNQEETKELAIVIRKHPDGKAVYDAFFGYKKPKTGDKV